MSELALGRGVNGPGRGPGRGRDRLVGWLLLVAVVGVLAAAPGTWMRSTYGARLSSDEPHYLLTAIALAEHGSLDISALHDAEAYRPFHEVRLPPQAAVGPDGRMVAPHDPLLPAVLAPAWRVGGWQGARLALALVNGALAAVVLWTAVRRFGCRPGPAAGLTGLAVASAPVAVYGSQLFPELPAALATVAAVAAATGPPRRRNVAVLVLAVVALPWLAVKYVPVAAALAGVALWRWWRGGARVTVVAAVLALGGAGVAYLVLHLRWYGGVTVYAAGEFFQARGGELTVVGDQPDYLGRSRRLVGLLVDASFGLAAWQPLWLAAVPGIASLARRRPPGAALLLAPAAAGWLTATFVALTMHGWWFPGRQVVVILPLLLLSILVLVDRGGRRLAVAVAVGTLGLLTWGWLATEALRGRLTLIVDFASTTNPWFRLWRQALPDQLQAGARTQLLHGLWLVVLLLGLWWGWRDAALPHPDRVRQPDPAG